MKIHKLEEAGERAILAKMVSEIAVERFPNSTVEFFAYPSVGRDGAYPGREGDQGGRSKRTFMRIS